MTIDQRLSQLTKSQRMGVDKVSQLIKCLGYPSVGKLMNGIKFGNIVNCPITHEDIKRYMMVYDIPIASIKGKMTHPTNSKMHYIERQKKTDKYATLHTDVMHANNIRYISNLSYARL